MNPQLETVTLAKAGYRMEACSDAHCQRVRALTTDGTELAGAYRNHELNDWKFYVTKTLAAAVEARQPFKAHACSRQAATEWVELLAALYTKATTGQPQSTGTT